MSDERLVKLHIDLPNHWGTGGESIWAEELGNDLFRIRNVPFYAYGLNFYDIVLAVPESPDLKPEIVKVVEPSGHRTFRVRFPESTVEDKRLELLKGLNVYSTYFERANSSFFAIDVEPEGSYQAVYDQLEEWTSQDLLTFETCEPRIEGSFDDLPEGS